MSDISKEQNLIYALRKAGLTFACAESCTGGLIAKRLTDIAGSSDVILGGVVSYAVSLKENILKVPSEIIEKYGVVSPECAEKMAKGVKNVTGASVTVSVTGIAGPSGGAPSTPVGHVCFGVCTDKECKTYTKRFGENLTRGQIRELAADFALEKATEIIKNI